MAQFIKLIDGSLLNVDCISYINGYALKEGTHRICVQYHDRYESEYISEVTFRQVKDKLMLK